MKQAGARTARAATAQLRGDIDVGTKGYSP